jgi:hypothetical protein
VECQKCGEILNDLEEEEVTVLPLYVRAMLCNGCFNLADIFLFQQDEYREYLRLCNVTPTVSPRRDTALYIANENQKDELFYQSKKKLLRWLTNAI